MADETDVLIVGAGPVGLLLACALQRQGIAHRLIEQRAERSYFCKALGVTPRTIELFEDFGIADAAIDAGLWLTGITTFTNGAESARVDGIGRDLPYAFLGLPQFTTERLLEDCLERRGGRVEYGMALTSFVERPEGGIEATLAGPSGAHTVACRWLVGCDGARSAVRKALGLAFEGDKYPMTFMLGDVEVDWDLPRGRQYRFQQVEDGQLTNMLVAVPIAGNPRRYRLSMALPEPDSAPASTAVGGESADTPTLDDIMGVASPMLPSGTGVSNLRWASTYRISHRIVPRYSQGAAFLAGDAAHIHPPIGGQGMNTGLQDAYNLAWRLALAARGRAAASLLDGYSAERHRIGQDVVEATSRAMEDAVANRPVLQDPGARESQIYITYRGSPDVLDEGAANGNPDAPQAGDRAPDALGLRRPYVAHALRLRPRLGGGRHLWLGYADASSPAGGAEAFADLADVLRSRLGDDLSAGLVVAAPDRPVGSERIPVLTDAEGSFRKAYGAAGGSTWLIRPDGYIAWRCDRPDATRLSRFLDRIVRPSS